ncbi:MAG: nickel-responsive transcriptional regulator NikR [Myxococcota bacterium]|nr:nickel-responsive transcriptional regulator NikR [Myxococcota bacterium]
MLSRVGISLEDDLLEKFDGLIAKRGYENRSEAVRDLIREELVKQQWASSSDDAPRVAVAILVYDHESRELGQKLIHAQHEAHDLVVSTLHVHMDHHNCLEVLVLKGRGNDVVKMGNHLISTRGVKLGKLVLATTGLGL